MSVAVANALAATAKAHEKNALRAGKTALEQGKKLATQTLPQLSRAVTLAAEARDKATKVSAAMAKQFEEEAAAEEKQEKAGTEKQQLLKKLFKLPTSKNLTTS
eukprot:g2918.t1